MWLFSYGITITWQSLARRFFAINLKLDSASTARTRTHDFVLFAKQEISTATQRPCSGLIRWRQNNWISWNLIARFKMEFEISFALLVIIRLVWKKSVRVFSRYRAIINKIAFRTKKKQTLNVLVKSTGLFLTESRTHREIAMLWHKAYSFVHVQR